ncbi:YtxH domain-containing protein [Chondromyces crocatus]|uniref:YtxH domain-containing protein n=1 Tax=Chondromyces crocatus TaxID=52 RepID=A0A0K1E749_CHOCO|nr:YtxH domain-containing protein [Chondromyces crocatus]AKT36674.1 uncharacterized protein CMC5_007940 [Chondromyces crocatus]
MIKTKYFLNTLTDIFPFQRKSSIDWIVPASIGLGLGVAAGIGLGVLVAPNRGDVTRQKLADGATKVKERALQAAQRVSEKAGVSNNHVAGALGRDAGGIS